MAKAKAKAMAEEEEEEEDSSRMKLYFQVRIANSNNMSNYAPKYDAEEHNWYVVDSVKSTAKQIRRMSRHHAKNPTSVCVNSTVYVIGGREIRLCLDINPNPDPPYYFESMDPKLSELWYTDTYIDDDGSSLVCARGWIKGPSMVHRRSEASAVAVDRKIYVFGGVEWLWETNWAEVYDIDSNSWSVFAPPLDVWSLEVGKCVVALLDDDFDFVVGVDNRKEKEKKKKLILLHMPELANLWSYDVQLGIWEMFDSEFGCWPTELAVVSLSSSGSSSNDTILLTIFEGSLCGYHLAQRMWFPCPIIDYEEDHNGALPIGYCIHLRLVSPGGSNGNLIVLWSTYLFPEGIYVHYTDLTVSYNQGALAAKVDSTDVFECPKGDDLVNCLAIAPRRGKNKGGDTPYMEEEMKKIIH